MEKEYGLRIYEVSTKDCHSGLTMLKRFIGWFHLQNNQVVTSVDFPNSLATGKMYHAGISIRHHLSENEYVKSFLDVYQQCGNHDALVFFTFQKQEDRDFAKAMFELLRDATYGQRVSELTVDQVEHTPLYTRCLIDQDVNDKHRFERTVSSIENYIVVKQELKGKIKEFLRQFGIDHCLA